MHSRTCLSILFVALAASALAGITGCSSSQGGAGGARDGTAGGGSEPACEGYAPRVFGCIVLPPDPNASGKYAFQSTGVVSAVRAAAADEPCVRKTKLRFGTKEDGAPTVLDLALPDGSTIAIGFDVPGFSAGSVAVGDTLDVDFQLEIRPFAGTPGFLRVKRAGALVVALGNTMPAGIEPVEGASECYSQDALCGLRRLTMRLDAPAGPAALKTGESAVVGGLLVTNDHYFRRYDVSGACDAGPPIEYLMSAVPAP